MPDLGFAIEGIEVAQFAAAPSLTVRLCVDNRSADEPIHSLLLRCQVQIAATRRRYDPQQQQRLYDLFGEPSQWATSLGVLPWTILPVTVPAFEEHTLIELLLPCSYDFNIAATKYLAGLEDGDIPLEFLFSGTIFHRASHGGLQVAPVPWDCQATYRLSASLWHELMEHYYPHGAWLRIERAIFERLREFKSRHALPTWDEALAQLLDHSQTASAAARE